MQYLMEQAARLNPHRKWQSVSVVLLDDAGISRINRLYLDREHVTDVISFATPTVVPADGWQGEIFVNVQRACEVGKDVAAALKTSWRCIWHMGWII